MNKNNTVTYQSMISSITLTWGFPKKGSSSMPLRPSFENITMIVKKPIIPITKTTRNFFLMDIGSFFPCFPSLDLKCKK